MPQYQCGASQPGSVMPHMLQSSPSFLFFSREIFQPCLTEHMWWNLNQAHLRSYWFDKSTFHGLLTQQVAIRPIPMSLVAF